MKTEGKPVWVSRDRGSRYVNLWWRKPKWNAEFEEFQAVTYSHLLELCVRGFKARTGLTIKPGQCLKIKLTAEVLEGEA